MTVNAVTEKLRQTARDLLQSGQVGVVIGFEDGRFPGQPRPAFIRRAEDADRLVWNAFCGANLAKYVLDYRVGDGKIAVVAKGCDGAALARIIGDQQFPRQRLVVLAVGCPGMLDAGRVADAAGLPDGAWDAALAQVAAAAEPGADGFELNGKPVSRSAGLRPQCVRCRQPNVPAALEPDVWLSEPAPERHPSPDQLYGDVAALEAMSVEERGRFWEEAFSRCLRCFACRNVCPVCDCRECVLDDAQTRWLGKAVNLAENQFFHLTRAMHVAGRCVGCGQCEEACPVGLPLTVLYRKLSHDLEELFGPVEMPAPQEGKAAAGAAEGAAAGLEKAEWALTRFRLNDPDEFD
ncbi:MAG: 4Fe-4S dicluster domain-containing protein [Firmicutes bacterium]|nr:4Fe-4S dicluster domain-containing protein [Bacillota bacterium]